MELKESRRLAAIAVKALEDKLATDISVIEIDKISPLGDYFVIATGRNYNQTEAMVDAVEEAGTKAGLLKDTRTETGRCLTIKEWSFISLMRTQEAFTTWTASGKTELP